ncbi:restriction endonuclease subunit S [Heyndrickxia coagulans]
MSEQTNLVPKRRFKEFQNTDAWEQRKLGDLLENAYQGINTAGDKVEYSESGVKILQSKHITSGNITFDDARYLDRDRYSEYLPKYVPNVDDILFANIGTIGPSAVVTEVKEFLIAWNILKMTPKKESNAKFIQLQLQRLNIKRYFESVTTGNATKFVNKDEMLRTQIIVPEKKEQSKIGEFFANLDNLITLHQRKLEKAKALKSAYLSEMFPAEGERVPKRRFAGFTQPWEQRKLKDFGKATGGTSIESEFVDGGKYKVISIGSYSEQSVYTDQNIRAELTDKTKNRILNKDDLTMILNDKTASGNIIGRVLLIDSNDSYVYNQRTERIEPDHEKYNSQFLYQLLNAPMIRSRIIKQAQGNTQIYVNWSAISELDYLVPNLDEQREIGAFFSNFDHLITLHQRKLEKLQNIKKAYLNEMFV